MKASPIKAKEMAAKRNFEKKNPHVEVILGDIIDPATYWMVKKSDIDEIKALENVSKNINGRRKVEPRSRNRERGSTFVTIKKYFTKTKKHYVGDALRFTVSVSWRGSRRIYSSQPSCRQDCRRQEHP